MAVGRRRFSCRLISPAPPALRSLPAVSELKALKKSNCNFETAISIRLWKVRRGDGNHAKIIAEALIAAKQAQGQSLNASPGDEGLSRVASWVNRRTRRAIRFASPAMSDATIGIVGLTPSGTRRATLT